MFRYLLPLALCCALLAAASARAIELEAASVTCDTLRGGSGGAHAPLVISQNEDDLTVTLTFSPYGTELVYPVIYSQPGLVVGKHDQDNLLVLTRDSDGKLSLRATVQRPDGSPGTKPNSFKVTCGSDVVI